MALQAHWDSTNLQPILNGVQRHEYQPLKTDFFVYKRWEFFENMF